MAADKRPKWPKCEYNNCYCKNHFPDRSGGPVEKVLMEDGSYKLYCQVARENDEDLSYCDICNHNFEGEGLYFLDKDGDVDISFCIRCCANHYSTHLEEYLLQLENEHPCELLEMFNLSGAFEDKEKNICGKCNKTFPNLRELFITDYIIDNACLNGGFRKFLGELSEKMKDPANVDLKNYLLGFKKFKREKLLQRNIQKAQDAEYLRLKAKRVIRRFFPSSTPEDQELILAKRKRLVDSELDTLFKTQNFIEFVEWLRND